MKSYTCRDHGGIFKLPPRRGRPPVRCTEQNPCSRSDYEPEATAKRRQVRDMQESAGNVRRQPEKAPEPSNTSNPSVAPAMAAKARLEPLGWVCKGKTVGATGAEMIATREGEIVTMRWENGVVTLQNYILWDERPSANGKPQGNLTFDPDECTDKELIRVLSGMKVTWWNALGQREESAVVGSNKIEIVHAYNGTGDEVPGDRIIKFSDHAGTGFRAFKMAALLKVG